MGQRSTINHNVQLFISLNNQYAIIMIIQWPPVEIYMCKLCPNQISITIWKFTTSVCIEHEVEVATSIWKFTTSVCIEHEVEVATSTRKH